MRLQQDTAYIRDGIRSDASVGAEPPLYKAYPDCGRIALPPLAPGGPLTLEETLKARRSVRCFGAEPLRLEQLGYLLWASQRDRVPAAIAENACRQEVRMCDKLQGICRARYR
jgi:hypothetical protein